jgi:hypothetical protein
LLIAYLLIGADHNSAGLKALTLGPERHIVAEPPTTGGAETALFRPDRDRRERRCGAFPPPRTHRRRRRGGRSTGTAKATVKYQGKTYAFKGGRCRHILDGFNLMIGKLAGSSYFSLQESRTLKAGTVHQAVLGFHVNGKYYDTKSMTLTITNGARKGTFSGKIKNSQTLASAGTVKGSFSC